MDSSDYLLGPPAASDRSVLLGLTARSTLRANVERVSGGTAYVDGSLRLNWSQTASRVDALAREFEAAGLGAGDVIGLHLPNSAAYAIAHLAIAEVGAVTLPLHVPYRAAELQQFLGATDAAAYVHDARDAAAFAMVRDALPALRVVVATQIDDAAFTLQGHAGTPRSRPPALDPDTPFCLVPTSGTESLTPKICMHAHDGLLSNARAFVDEAQLDETDVLLVGSGYTHLFGLLGVHASLLAGATLVSLRKFEGNAFLNAAAAERATRAWAVPAQLIDLVACARERSDTFALREIRTAGAAAAAPLVRDVRATLGGSVTVHWGMSELGGGISSFGRDFTAASSSVIGTPIAGAEVRIARADGSTAEAGEVGELWYRRADLFRGYFRDAVATARAVTPDGWLRTGDLAACDAAGVLHFHGREKDIINRGGFKIGAAELEASLHGLPAIRRCAVVAVPDARLGERACLVVELDGTATVTLAEVAALLDARGVAKYKWPEHLLVVDAMPMTPTNKIAKSAVRALAAERLAAAEAVHA